MRLVARLCIVGALAALLAACGGGSSAPDEIVVPPTTKVLTADMADTLTAFEADGTLRFSDTSIGTFLQPGDVVVSGPASAAPAGLLRRVVSLRDVAGGIAIETEPAKLGDAIYRGGAQVSRDLGSFSVTQSDSAAQGLRLQRQEDLSFPIPPINVIISDADGDESTTDDQVRITGNGNFQLGFEVALGFKTSFEVDWTPVKIRTHVRSVFYVRQTSNLTMVAGRAASFDKDVEIASYPLDPIVFAIGPVPVVIVPTLALHVFANGNVAATVSYGVNEQVEVSAGFDKPYDGGFTPIAALTPTASAPPPNLDSVNLGVTFDAGAGVELRGGLKFYGVAGPFLSLKPEMRLTGTIPGDPAWRLDGAVNGEVGLYVDVFHFDYDWSAPVFGDTFPIAQAEGNTPPTIVSFTATPFDGQSYQVAQPVTLSTVSTDLQDGQILGGSYRSDVDGPLVLDASNRVVFNTPGSRDITVTVTDSDGATAQATKTVDVINTPPTVSIDRPLAGDDLYRGISVVLVGAATDPNELDGVVPCWAMEWTSSDPDDTMPTSNCGDVVTTTFDTLGYRTLTLTAYDSHGAVSNAKVTVQVQEPPAGNLPPTATIIQPSDGASFDDIHGLTMSGRAYDPDNSGLLYVWTILWDGGSDVIDQGTVTGTDVPGGALLEAFWDPYPACRASMTLRLEVGDGTLVNADERAVSCSKLPQ